MSPPGWGLRKYSVRSALPEAADKSVGCTQGRLVLRGTLLQTHDRRQSWGRNKEREDQLCIKLCCKLGAIIAGQACDLGFWHPDTDDAVGTQVHCLGIVREAGLYPQYAWRLDLVQVQGITDVWYGVTVTVMKFICNIKFRKERVCRGEYCECLLRDLSLA